MCIGPVSKTHTHRPTGPPERLLDAPRLPQLHYRLHIAAGAKGAVASALQRAGKAARAGGDHWICAAGKQEVDASQALRTDTPAHIQVMQV